jgi:hypothetical protein
MADTPAAIARRAYETLEPYHVLAYFNPGLHDAQTDLGLDGHAFYVGARGSALGATVPAVVTATFFNFAPGLIATAWAAATDAGLAEIDERRYVMLDEQYRAILGESIADIAALLPEYRAVVADLPMSGRPLGAAWAATALPEAPHLELWRHLSVLREWRGDNHIAELVRHGLTGLEAGVLHEAQLPDPTVKRRVLGRRFFQLSRGWSDVEWEIAVRALAARGIVEVDGDPTADPESAIAPVPGGATHRVTDAGYQLYREIEAGTDAMTGAALSPAFADLIDRTRPLVKLVIDAGVLPGTRKR